MALKQQGAVRHLGYPQANDPSGSPEEAESPGENLLAAVPQPASHRVAVYGSYHASNLRGLHCCTLVDQGPPRIRIHDRLVLLTLTAGQAVIQCRGAVQTLHPGGVLLVEPGDVHRDLSKSAYCAKMVVVNADLVAALRRSGPNRHLGPIVTYDAALRVAVLDLVRIVNQQRTSTAQEDHAGRLFQCLLPHWTARPPQVEPALVTRARRLFVEEPACELSLLELARRLRCAPTYLCRVFAEHMGVGPHGYQVHCRLLYARALIESGKKIADAAVQAGFADESHLHRHFRRRFAAAPGSYHRALAVRSNRPSQTGGSPGTAD